MHIRTKVLALAAASATTLTLGLAAGMTSAEASSTGCAFTNGCATLHGTDAAGDTVAMDAKYQNKNEILIGYPDNASDGATSFDGVLHYGKGKPVTTYQDTGLVVTHFDNTCSATSADVAPVVTGNGGTSGTISDGTNDLSQSTGVSHLTVSGSGATLGWSTVTPPVTIGPALLTVAEDYGAGCVALWHTTVTISSVTGDATFAPLTFTLVTSGAGGHIHETNTGSSADTFTDTVSGGTFSFTALPAGITPGGTDNGVLTADTSTAIPGTYTSVGVVYTEPGGVVDTASFDLIVTGIKSVTPGAGVPFYTFVYAPHGDWTSQCVTDINGSGALKLVACTLGKDTGQDFTIGATTPGLLSGSQAPVRNLLAEAANPADSYLTDPSTSNPATPQSDAADERIPGGRQLYVNGPDTNLWSWGT